MDWSVNLELVSYVKDLDEHDVRYFLGCLPTALRYDMRRAGTKINTFKEFGIPEEFRKIAYLIVDFYKADTERKFANKIKKFAEDIDFFVVELLKAEISTILQNKRQKTEKIEKHLLSYCQEFVDDLPNQSEGTANRTLKKLGLELKKLPEKFEFYLLANEDGDSVRFRFEKLITPKNRIEFYVTEKEWLKLKRNDKGLWLF